MLFFWLNNQKEKKKKNTWLETRKECEEMKRLILQTLEELKEKDENILIKTIPCKVPCNVL